MRKILAVIAAVAAIGLAFVGTTSAQANTTYQTTRPTAYNTGPTLNHNTIPKVYGNVTLSTPNQVYENKWVNGTLTITAPGVRVKNVIVQNPVTVDSCITNNAAGTFIEYTYVLGCDNSIRGNEPMDLYFVELSGMKSDGVKIGSNSSINYSWIGNNKSTTADHGDGIQIETGVENTYILNNTVDVFTGGTGNAGTALISSPEIGSSGAGPLVISGNYFDGGATTVQVTNNNNTGATQSRVIFTDNVFGTHHLYNPHNIATVDVFRGNVEQ